MVIQSYLVHRSHNWHRDGRFIELFRARIPRRDFQRLYGNIPVGTAFFRGLSTLCYRSAMSIT